MNREIKFRAWDKEIGVMFDEEVSTACLSSMLKQESKVIMQYSGLKANGFELYEGDVIENDGDWYQITWDNEQGRWEATGIKSTGESIALWELADSNETWVQGNIYENPELLECSCACHFIDTTDCKCTCNK